MQAQQQIDEGDVSAQPKNTASKFYRVNREANPERDERVRALHERFFHRTKLRAAWEAQECRDIRAAQDLRLWEECGCTHLAEYLMRTCGFTRREASERIRVAFALADLPRLEDELEAGRLSFSSVRELVRVVIADKQDEWIEHCNGLLSDQVARAVSGHKRGDSPEDPVDPDEHRHTISFSVRDYTRARFNAAVRALRKVQGHDFADDDALFQTITDALETYVSGPVKESTDEGVAREDAPAANDNTQVEYVASTTQLGHSAQPVTAQPDQGAGQKPDDVIESVKLKAMRKALSRPPVYVWLMPDGRGYAHDAEVPKDELETLLCDCVEMGDVNDPKGKKRKRISDRERARIYALHGNKCAVDGCTAEPDDIHHIQPLEDGGRDEPENEIPICKGHHRMRHAGKLKITGVAPFNVTYDFVTPPVAELDN